MWRQRILAFYILSSLCKIGAESQAQRLKIFDGCERTLILFDGLVVTTAYNEKIDSNFLQYCILNLRKLRDIRLR